MKDMERQAQATDRAIAKLGLTTDTVGNRQQQKQIGDLDRTMRMFGRGVDDTGGRVRTLNRDLDQNDSRFTRMRRSVIEAGATIKSLGAIIGLLKLPAMGAALGLVGQAVGALSGGIIALIPRVTQLAGLAAPLPIIFAGMATAMATVKLATSGLSQALTGNKAALKALTPEARAFVTTLREYHSVLQGLRQSAQGGLFAGLDTAVVRLQRGVPIANQLLQGMSKTLGTLAAQASNRFTTPGFLQDLLGIGQAGNRTVGRGGEALLNAIDAIRQLSVAAIPFTDRLGKLTVQFSAWFDRWATFERDSGRFGSFLNKTTESMQMLGGLVKNVWTWVSALGRAAAPLGDMLWRDADRGTKSWSAYANSVRGQVKLTQQFLGMHDSLAAIVTLLDDVGRSIFKMGSSQALPQVVEALDKMVPDIERLLTLFANTFGPVLAQLLGQVVKTLTFLTAATGPVNIFLSLLGKVLGLFNSLLGAVPALATVVSSAFSVVTIGLFIGKLRGVAAAWGGVTAAATTAGAAQASAMGAPIVGGGGGAAIGRAGGSMLATGEAAGIGMLGGIRTGQLVRPSVRSAFGPIEGAIPEASTFAMETPAFGFGLSGGAAAAGLLGGRMAGIGARLAGIGTKFVLPAELALGAYGAATANVDPRASFGTRVGQRLGGAVSAATFGAISPIQTPGQQSRSAAAKMFTEPGKFHTGGGLHFQGGGALTFAVPMRSPRTNYESFTGQLNRRLDPYGGDSPGSYGQLEGQVRIYRQVIAQAKSVRDLDAQGVLTQHAYVRGLQQQLQARQQVLTSIRTQRREEEQADAYKILRQEGQAIDVYSKKFGLAGATSRVSADVLQKMGAMHAPAARTLGTNYLEWERGQMNDKSLSGGTRKKLSAQYQQDVDAVIAQFKRLGIAVAVVNGQIVEGTKSQWNQLSAIMGNAAEHAREVVSQEFTAIQERAERALELMGVRSGNAHALVQGIESGRVTASGAAGVASGALSPGGVLSMHATGGRGGSHLGGRDTMLAAIAPDELVVNRHTERDVNRMLAPTGRSLGSMVGFETHPNHMPMRAFATGGRGGGSGGPSLGDVHPGIRSIAQAVMGRFPLSLTSTTTGNHVDGSYHYLGEAVDLSGSTSLMNQAAAWIGANLGSGLLEGIHNPNLSVKFGKRVPDSYWGASTWAGHANHIHLAAGDGGGARGLATMTGNGKVAFAAPKSHLGGIPGILADQASSLVSSTLRKRLNASMGGSTSTAGLSGGTSGQNQTLAYQMMLQRWPSSEWPSLKALWMGESGFNTFAKNPSSGAYGIPQSLPASKMGAAGSDYLTNPATQIKWGEDYIAGRYGSPSAAYNAWSHRNPHWYSGGMKSGTFRKPTLIGVGDTPGGETVSVKRLGQGGGSFGTNAGGGVVVHIDTIVQQEPGDTRKIVLRELSAVAHELRTMGLEGDEELAH